MDVPDDEAVKQLIELRLDEPLPKDVDSTYARFINNSHTFELFQSETSVECCVRTLFELFNLKPLTEKITVQFGRVDMMLSTPDQDLMNCAVEVKGPAAYDLLFKERCRYQLAAYIISMGIENSRRLNVINGKRFTKQNLLGILHIGLTPIFYKAEITDEYLDAILPLSEFECNDDKIPQLLISEFVPVSPYTDRELLRSRESRSVIFKSYQAFRNLADKYADEKIKLTGKNVM